MNLTGTVEIHNKKNNLIFNTNFNISNLFKWHDSHIKHYSDYEQTLDDLNSFTLSSGLNWWHHGYRSWTTWLRDDVSKFLRITFCVTFILKLYFAHFWLKSFFDFNVEIKYPIEIHNSVLSSKSIISIVMYWLTHTLLLRILCSLGDFASQNILLLNTFCFLEHFVAQPSLLLGTLNFLEDFASQHTLLPGTLCSLEHFAPW